MNKLIIETWHSDCGNSEMQHFLKGDHETYVFGINRKLLGDEVYEKILQLVKEELKAKQVVENE